MPDTMASCPNCGKELKAGICLSCDSGNVFKRSSVTAPASSSGSGHVLKDNVFIRSDIDLSTTINLSVDEGTLKSGFLQTLLKQLNLQADELPREGGVWKIPVRSTEAGNRTLSGIKSALSSQLQELKAAHRKLLARDRVNQDRREAMKDRVELLRKNNPDSRELVPLEKTVQTLGQYRVKAVVVEKKIGELTDHLHAVTAMQEEAWFKKDLGEASSVVGQLVEDAVKVVAQAQEALEVLK